MAVKRPRCFPQIPIVFLSSLNKPQTLATMEITATSAEMLPQVADDDAEKPTRLREICSCFLNLEMLYKESVGIAMAASKEETV